MTMLAVLSQALWRRRVGLLGWALGLVGVAGLLAVAYPTVRDNAELDKTFTSLSPSVQAVLGLTGGLTLTSPAGYLNSQFYANVLPVMLLVFAVGVAAWAVAGDEAAGTLELLLANPVSRARVAAERAGALLVLLAALTAVCAAALVAVAGFVVQGLAQQVQALRPVQAVSPWHWLLASDPLRNGLVWRAWLLPLASTAVLVLLGTIQVQHRDLR